MLKRSKSERALFNERYFEMPRAVSRKPIRILLCIGQRYLSFFAVLLPKSQAPHL